VLISQVDEVLELAWLPVKPVEVPHHDSLDLARFDVGEHPPVRGPRRPALAG
jgi:hypothetical protein